MFEDWLAHVVVAASLSGGLFESFMSVRAQTADVWLGFFSSELLTFGICSLPLLLLLLMQAFANLGSHFSFVDLSKVD